MTILVDFIIIFPGGSMRLNKLCYVCDIRKRKIVRLLTEAGIGLSLGQKIIRAMQFHNDPYLAYDDLTLLRDLIGTPYTAVMFSDEIEKAYRKEHWA